MTRALILALALTLSGCAAVGTAIDVAPCVTHPRNCN